MWAQLKVYLRQDILLFFNGLCMMFSEVLLECKSEIIKLQINTFTIELWIVDLV